MWLPRRLQSFAKRVLALFLILLWCLAVRHVIIDEDGPTFVSIRDRNTRNRPESGTQTGVEYAPPLATETSEERGQNNTNQTNNHTQLTSTERTLHTPSELGIGGVKNQIKFDGNLRPLSQHRPSRTLSLSAKGGPQTYRRLASRLIHREGWLVDVDWKPTLDHHRYEYLIFPRHTCRSGGQRDGDSRYNSTVLILVFSAPGNQDRRDAIRQTWLRGAAERNVSVRVIFLLGAPRYHRQQQNILREAQTHGDILQEEFVDSYYNLSIKLVMALKWTATFCNDSAFFMKVDDDVVVNVFSLAEDLSSGVRYDFVAGMKVINGKPMRDSHTKWYTPRNIYLDRTYPPYLQGHGYIMSIDMAEKLYRVSQKVELFPWEDVYLGILLQMLGIKPLHRSSFEFTGCVKHYNSVIRTNNTLLALTKGYLTWDLSIQDMYTVWNAIQDNHWSELSGEDICLEDFIQTAEYLP